MTALALLKVPLLSVDRRPHGTELGSAGGNINGRPITMRLTENELHIAFVDRDGPAFIVDLHSLAKAAVAEIEAQLGYDQKRKA